MHSYKLGEPTMDESVLISTNGTSDYKQSRRQGDFYYKAVSNITKPSFKIIVAAPGAKRERRLTSEL